MSVVFDRPYEFVPPHTGQWWPNFIQAFRIYDYYLRRAEGVTSHEVHGIEHFAGPLIDGDGIVLAPNHCRYADPLVLGWPARQLGTHLHAVASWHLFHKSAFDRFSLRRMGAFSLNREQTDRRSLDCAIDTIAGASRPLVIFPEGATFRTNDDLKPLLDGVSFLARTASRRAAKQNRRVRLIPVALKYLCSDPVQPWANTQLLNFERRFGWRDLCRHDRLLDRVHRIESAWIGLVAARFGCDDDGNTLAQRRRHLMDRLLTQSESLFGVTTTDDDPASRARSIRSLIAADHYSDAPVNRDSTLRWHSSMADTVLDLYAYPPNYLDPGQATDTRVVESIQRMQEQMMGKADASMRLKVIIDFGEAMEVPPEKSPRNQTDPLLQTLDERLREKLAGLSKLAPVISAE